MSAQYNNYRPGPFSMIPPTIRALIGINVLVFLLMMLLPDSIGVGGIAMSDWFRVQFSLMPINSSFFNPWWQLVTYQFLHAGLSHLFFNMLALWMFGSELEQIWGSRRFLVYYLLCGIAGGALHLATAPDAPTVGASGAIMGVLVGFGMTFPNRPVMIFPIFIPIPAKYFVMIYAAIDLFSGFTASADNVAHFAHVGGAIMGFLLLKFGDRLGVFKAADRIGDSLGSFESFRDSNRPSVRTARFREVPQPTAERPLGGSSSSMFHGGSFFHNGEYIDENKVNSILDKINSSGYDSLDQREKDILMEISRRMNN